MAGFKYVDRVGNVSVINGIVHIELLVTRPAGGDGRQQVRAEPVERIVMALPRFVRLCAEMDGHLERMETKGLITRRVASGAAATQQQAMPEPIAAQPEPVPATAWEPPPPQRLEPLAPPPPPPTAPAPEPAPARKGGFFWRR
jgi:hypothetical protein